MFDLQVLTLFLVAAIALNITPGPDFIYVMTNSIGKGRQAGILSAIGLGIGYLLHTVAATFGLSVILSTSALAYNILKYMGAAYLIYLGLRSLLTKASIHSTSQTNNRSTKTIVRQGIVTSTLNPKVALFFLSFLPQFVNASENVAVQFLILGCIFTTTATIWHAFIASFAGYLGEWLKQNTLLMQLQRWFTGTVLVGLGLRMTVAEHE